MMLVRNLLVVLISHNLCFSAVAFSQDDQQDIPAIPDEIPEDPTVTGAGTDGAGKPKKIYNGLKLTKEQKRKILEVKKSFRPALLEAKKAIDTAKMAYKKSFDKVGPDSELEEKFSALQQARQKYSDVRFKQMLKIRALLDKNQKKMFHQLKAELRKISK